MSENEDIESMEDTVEESTSLYRCSKCRDRGYYVPKDRMGVELADATAVMCECRLTKTKAQMQGANYANAHFPKSVPVRTVDAVIEYMKKADPSSMVNNLMPFEHFKGYADDPAAYLESGPQVLWISGDSMSGKTSFALALGGAVLNNTNKLVRYINDAEFFSLIRNFDTWPKKFNQLQKYDVYIFDNFFNLDSVNSLSAYEFKQLYLLFSALIDQTKHIITTSNQTLMDLYGMKADHFSPQSFISMLMRVSIKEETLKSDALARKLRDMDKEKRQRK